MLDVVSLLVRMGEATTIIHTFTNVIASSVKPSELVLNLLASSNPKSDLQRQLVYLFARDEMVRQSQSIGEDHLKQFLDSDGCINYADNTDDLIRSVMLSKKTNIASPVCESSIEQISNLESIATQVDLEYTLRSGAIDQLSELYLQFCRDESSFSKAYGVRPSQLRSYW